MAAAVVWFGGGMVASRPGMRLTPLRLSNRVLIRKTTWPESEMAAAVVWFGGGMVASRPGMRLTPLRLSNRVLIRNHTRPESEWPQGGRCFGLGGGIDSSLRSSPSGRASRVQNAPRFVERGFSSATTLGQKTKWRQRWFGLGVGWSLRDQAGGLRRCACRTGFSSATTLGQKTKWPHPGAILFSGGEGGIRTHEGLLTLAGFQDQCIQPLCHLSKLFYPPFAGGLSGGLRRKTSAWTRRVLRLALQARSLCARVQNGCPAVLSNRSATSPNCSIHPLRVVCPAACAARPVHGLAASCGSPCRRARFARASKTAVLPFCLTALPPLQIVLSTLCGWAVRRLTPQDQCMDSPRPAARLAGALALRARPKRLSCRFV